MSIFGDYKIDGTQLVATETGAAIPLTTGFLRDVFRMASFVWVINGVRASRVLKGRAPRANISFYPRKPRSFFAIWPVCQLADVKIVDEPDEADFHFYFEDREFLIAPRKTPTPRPAFNAGCFDIRKSVVARVFEETFGYGISVDPLTHHGTVVEKSEANGKHDGRKVQCPIAEPAPGKVYQRIIENTFDGDEYIDIRTPIVGGNIPCLFLKRRTKDLRFTNENHRVDLVDTDTMLSKDEQAQILAFARGMALDFGGLDVLRNRDDGKIYIVDVNKTDMGPPSAMRGPDKLRAMRCLADAFAGLVDETLSA